MKKFLLSIFAVMLAVFSVQAEEATLSFANKAQRTSFSTTQQVWEQNGIKLTNDKGSSTSNVADYANPARFYKSSKITIDAPGNIDKIEFTCSGSYATALKSSIKNTEATVSVNGSVVTAIPVNTGTSFTIASLTGGQVRMTSLKVYYTVAGGDEEDNQTATPVITPNGGEITADTEITISCENEGAQIYYTINGDEPTTSSTSYSGPFTLDAPATVKAIAVADGLEASAVATAEFTFPVVCENIAAFIENADKDNNTTISGEVVVVAQSGKYLFVQDNSAKIIVYGELGKEYKAGDRLTGIKGKYTNYNGLHEMYPDTESFGEATAGDAIDPVAITLDELATTDLLTYVTISDVNVPAGSGKSYTVTDDTGTATMYNTLGIEVPAGVATITGFVGTYNTTRQLMPLIIEITEQAVNVAEPTFTPADGTTFDESLEVTIEAEEGLTVYYSTDNKETYTEGKTLNIYETTTVYAYAENADGDVSDIVSATYTKNTPVTPPAEGEATVEVNAKDYFGDATINISKIVEAPVTLTFAKNNGGTEPAYNKAGDCRIYAKGSITAACSAGNLTRIVFEVSAQGKKRLTDLTPSTGTVTIADDHSTITWEGNAPEVVLTVGEKAVYGTDGESKAGQICFTSFAATYTSGNVETPYYTLTVGETGYATLFLDFAATVPAFEDKNGVFAAKVKGNYVDLTKVEGVLPANTGVIVKAAPGEYTFTYTDKEATVDTDLKGTATAEYITPAGTAYVLGKLDGKVALYKAMLTDGKFLNNANKAYLVVANANPAAQYSFRFGEGTTGIENVESAEAVKAIFDLTGRRVEAVTAPGIYIVNGKKVIVK